MQIRTHEALDRALSGEPVHVAPGQARVRLDTTDRMVADGRGLVHGGFVFSAGDHAAMLAVGDPFVVLGAASTRFLAPVRVGQVVWLEARVVAEKGRKREVDVRGEVDGTPVFEGSFTAFVLDRHVLDPSGG